VKNLIKSMCYKTEILRLGPQNDIATQSLDRSRMLSGQKDSGCPIKTFGHDAQNVECSFTYSRLSKSL